MQRPSKSEPRAVGSGQVVTDARACQALRLARALVADLLDSDERFRNEVAGANLGYVLFESNEADAPVGCRVIGEELVWSTRNGRPPAEDQKI